MNALSVYACLYVAYFASNVCTLVCKLNVCWVCAVIDFCAGSFG